MAQEQQERQRRMLHFMSGDELREQLKTLEERRLRLSRLAFKGRIEASEVEALAQHITEVKAALRAVEG